MTCSSATRRTRSATTSRPRSRPAARTGTRRRRPTAHAPQRAEESSETMAKLHYRAAGRGQGRRCRQAFGRLAEGPPAAGRRLQLLPGRPRTGAEQARRGRGLATGPCSKYSPKNALAMNNVAWLMAQPGQARGRGRGRAGQPDCLPGARPADRHAWPARCRRRRPAAQGHRGPEAARSRSQPAGREPAPAPGAGCYIKAGEKPQARTELEELTRLGDKFAAQAEVAELLKVAR
ncbi:MAG: hypothetical protein MZW92_27015 [Comamonadaceae bacterium]|nr:hypothetical protein [Comamonadaceae bacterium]